MAKAFRTTIIDKEKFGAWTKKVMKENHIKNVNEFADKIGYNHTFVYNTMARGTLSIPAIKVLEAVYALDVNDILPDPPKAETKDEEQKTADTTKIEDMLKEIVKASVATQQMTEDIRKGFRVQTTPRLDTESIAEGVKAGMEAFWRNKKDDIVRMLNGIIFAANFEAGKKLDELRNDQQKVWKVK